MVGECRAGEDHGKYHLGRSVGGEYGGAGLGAGTVCIAGREAKHIGPFTLIGRVHTMRVEVVRI